MTGPMLPPEVYAKIRRLEFERRLLVDVLAIYANPAYWRDHEFLLEERGYEMASSAFMRLRVIQETPDEQI